MVRTFEPDNYSYHSIIASHPGINSDHSNALTEFRCQFKSI